MVYGQGAASQFSVKHQANNLPLIRNESHDSKLKENTQRFGTLAQA